MILAIETSCDETAVALFDPLNGLAGEWVHSQIALHGRYGGVVPDLATREHLRTIAPLISLAREHLGGLESVKQVAVTYGPGLAGCLALGTAAAKALAMELSVPLVGVNHLRGHAFSPFIQVHMEAPATFTERLQTLLPHLGLIVSGGNTLLFRLDRELRITVISSTRDDAAGEAFDKGAKLLGLGYPGGPLIEKNAKAGRSDAYDFPRGIGPRSELDFSFSGLKTSLRYLLEKMTPEQISAQINDLCASYQQAIVDALVKKTANAFALDAYASLGLSGGVANNGALRTTIARLAEKRRVPFFPAEPRHTGDNAGMIAFAAWIDPLARSVELDTLEIDPSAEIVNAGVKSF